MITPGVDNCQNKWKTHSSLFHHFHQSNSWFHCIEKSRRYIGHWYIDTDWSYGNLNTAYIGQEWMIRHEPHKYKLVCISHMHCLHKFFSAVECAIVGSLTEPHVCMVTYIHCLYHTMMLAIVRLYQLLTQSHTMKYPSSCNYNISICSMLHARLEVQLTYIIV